MKAIVLDQAAWHIACALYYGSAASKTDPPPVKFGLRGDQWIASIAAPSWSRRGDHIEGYGETRALALAQLAEKLIALAVDIIHG